MPEVTVERRNSPRYSMVLAADVISPPGAPRCLPELPISAARATMWTLWIRFHEVPASNSGLRIIRKSSKLSAGGLRQPESRYGYTIHGSLARPAGSPEPLAGSAAPGIL